jgi:hypothetical protein
VVLDVEPDIQTAEEAKDFVLMSETKDVVRTKPSAALKRSFGKLRSPPPELAEIPTFGKLAV